MGVLLDTGGVAHGAMLRVTDVKAGLECLPVSPHARGEVVLEVDDPVLPQNARAWRVVAREGRLHVKPEAAGAGHAPQAGGPAPKEGRVRLPRLKVPADVLGPLLAGTLSATGAAASGLIESSGGAEVVESWFRAKPAFLYPMNVF
jgi:hypothetical protein